MRHVGISVIAGLLLFAGTLTATAQTNDPSTILVKVNNENILQSDIDFLMVFFVLPQYAAANGGKSLPEDQKPSVIRNLIEQMITEKLILQFAAQTDISIDEGILEKQFATIKEQQPHIPPEKLKEFLRQKLLIQTVLQQEVASKVNISDTDLQQIYESRKEEFNEPEQVRASHILIKVDSQATQSQKDAARKKIDEILSKARSGQDFSALAKEYSDCPSNTKGGDLGFFARNIMVKPFDDMAFSLNEGEISDIVETPFGYHIIKVTGKKSQRVVSFEEAKERLRQESSRQQTNANISKWVVDLRANATIEYFSQ